MLFSATTIILSALSALTAVSAETHTVTVGKGGSLLYEPSSVTAKAGDVIEFQFMSKNHTITQSTFAAPCTAKPDGVDSGYQFIPAGSAPASFPTWSITVQNDTAPLWFYCAQAPHCVKGMVFAINPTAEKTFDTFHKAALALDTGAGSAAGGYGASAPGSAGGATTGTSGSAAGGAAGGSSSAATPGGTPAANAEALTNPGNGAVGRGASWGVVLGAVVLGALAL